MLWLRFLNEESREDKEPAEVVDEDFMARSVFLCFTEPEVGFSANTLECDRTGDEEPESVAASWFDDVLVLRLNSRFANVPISVVELLELFPIVVF